MSITIEKGKKNNRVLDRYRAYALLEKEHNLLLFRETLDKDSDKDLVDIKIEETNKAFEEFKKTVKIELSEQIDKQRVNIKETYNLKRAFTALIPSKSGAAVIGLEDPSYLIYATSSDAGGSDNISAPSYPILDQLQSVAKVMLAAHLGLIGQSIYGAVSIIKNLTIELIGAKRLEKGMGELEISEGRMLRLKKSMVVIGLFIIRAVFLGISIWMTMVALTSVVGTTVLLFAALSTYLVEVLRHLRADRNFLAQLNTEKQALKDKINELSQKIVDPSISVQACLALIDQLQALRLELGRKEGAITLLERAVLSSIGKRNKTVYNAAGATLIILSIFAPPLFFVGLSMLVIPLVVGMARYADEKWNKARISTAIANSPVGHFIRGSTVYKRMFGLEEKPRQAPDMGNVIDFGLGRENPQEGPKVVQPKTIMHNYVNSRGAQSEEANPPGNDDIPEKIKNRNKPSD